MAKPYLAVLCYLVLTACNSGPAFDVSSQAAYLKSLDAITEKLAPRMSEGWTLRC